MDAGSVSRGWRKVGGVWVESRRPWMCGIEVHAYGVQDRVHGCGGIAMMALSRWMVEEWKEGRGWELGKDGSKYGGGGRQEEVSRLEGLSRECW